MNHDNNLVLLYLSGQHFSQDFLFSSRFFKLYYSVHFNTVFSLSLHPIPFSPLYPFLVSLCFLFLSYLLIFSLCVAFTFLFCFHYLFSFLNLIQSPALFHFIFSSSLCISSITLYIFLMHTQLLYVIYSSTQSQSLGNRVELCQPSILKLHKNCLFSILTKPNRYFKKCDQLENT
jgi:hypothetical protein